MIWVLIIFIFGGGGVAPVAHYDSKRKCELAAEIAKESVKSSGRAFCVPADEA